MSLSKISFLWNCMIDTSKVYLSIRVDKTFDDSGFDWEKPYANQQFIEKFYFLK